MVLAGKTGAKLRSRLSIGSSDRNNKDPGRVHQFQIPKLGCCVYFDF